MHLLQKILPKKFEQKHFVLLFILLIASFLRLYNIPNTVQFLGDQGRDAMVVAKIFKDLDPVFIGPVTSVGNMYLGPLYYYFMVPFLMLTYPSPMGPVYAIALLGILTVFLMYYIGKQFLDEKVALWASGLFGLSAVVAHNTRFSWNPNPAPIVSLFLIFFTYKALKKDVKYWIAVTVCFAILIQLHYLTLLSGAGFGLVWLYQLFTKLKTKKRVKPMLTATFVGALIFFASLTPLFLFDLKHDGLNRNAFLDILTKEDAFSKKEIAEDSNPVTLTLLDLRFRSEQIVTEIAAGKHSGYIDLILTVIILWRFLAVIHKKRQKKKDITAELIIASFLFTGILGTTAYKQNIYEHYIAYLFPVIFFTLAIVMNDLLSKKLGYLFVGAYLLIFAKFNYNHATVILHSLGWTIAHIQAVSDTIVDRVADGEKYNIVLLNATGDINGQNYRYFLTTTKKPPVPEEQYGEVETLFIIDEERKFDKEVDSPVYEIVTFPNKVPTEVYTIPNGPEITVLRKNSN